ncbi:hypothetical protein PHJA_001705000 [Phtheirospermum japonicum]|uniref:Uncharacterized protein n=1 Tax=Phtheirospermum japonicum TaxID=374723 RepID=A0A830CEY0_9LAMI|nr:hypothetical protein PHJA_001705000 [Phtheirospermum japonicum]
MDFKSFDAAFCREALLSYDAVIKGLEKSNLVALDDFYRNELPNLLHRQDPNPYITIDELSRLMEWKLARGKWRPRLLSFVSSLNDAVVRDTSGKAFASLPDVSKAVGELTVLKGMGPATASAVLAAYAPDVAQPSAYPPAKSAASKAVRNAGGFLAASKSARTAGFFCSEKKIGMALETNP